MADKTVDILLKIKSDLDGIRQAKEETNRFRNQLKDIGDFFRGGLGFGAGILSIDAFARALGDAMTAGIKFNAEVEQQTVAFETLLGSQEAAVERIQFLNQFSASTPFELGEVVEANRLLQTLTDGALATEAGMRLAGDAAAAAGRDFTETAMWVGRLYSSLQSGLPIGEATMRLTEMGLISGETRLELERLARDGALGAARAMEVLEDTLGSTAGAMEKQSQTFNGLFSTVKDNLLIIAAELSKPSFEGLKVALEALGQGIGAIQTEEQKRVETINEQTRGIQEQVQSMSSLEDLEATRERLLRAQELAESRINALIGQRKNLREIQREAASSGENTDAVTESLQINRAEITAYREQIRTVQQELARFGEVTITQSVEEIDSQIKRMQNSLAYVNKEILEQSTKQATPWAITRLITTGQPEPIDPSLLENKALLESNLESLEFQREIAQAVSYTNDLEDQTAQQIVEANRQRIEAEELTKARTESLREAQDWLSKNREKIEESLEAHRFEKLELTEQLSVLQARKQLVDEEFETRISNATDETVIERLKLEQQSEQLSISKEIEQVESKILDQKQKQTEESARLTREETKRFIQSQEQQLQDQLQNVNRARAIVSADFRSTSFETRQVEIELMRREIDLQQQFIKQLHERHALETDPAAREVLLQRIDASNAQLFGMETQRITMEMEADPFSFSDQFESELVQMRDSWGTFAEQSAQAFSGAINASINTASRELTNAILITGEWKDALMSIPRVITTEIVNAIIQMGLRWVATQAMMAMMGKSMQATLVASTAPMAAASASLWAPAATLATIATGGAAAAAAPPAVAGSIAATKATSVLSAGFKEGRYTGSGSDDEPAGIVHRNEYVIPAPIVREIGLEPLEAIVNREIGRDELTEMREGFQRGGFAGGGINRIPDPSKVRSPIRPVDQPFASPTLQQSMAQVAEPIRADQLAPVFDPQINVGSPGVSVVVVDSPDRLRRMVEENPDLQDAIVKVLDGRNRG